MKNIMVYVDDKPEHVMPYLDNIGTILANYGQSVLLRMDDKHMPELGEANIRFREIKAQPVVNAGAFAINIDEPQPVLQELFLRGDASSSSPGTSTRILKLAGPMHVNWKKELEEKGVKFLGSIDDSSYKADIPDNALEAVGSLPYVEGLPVKFPPEFKINPALITYAQASGLYSRSGLMINKAAIMPAGDNLASDAKNGNIEIVIAPEFISRDMEKMIESTGATVKKIEAQRIIAFAQGPEIIKRIAYIDQVREINPYRPYKLHNNIARDIIGVNSKTQNYGLDGSGQVIAICDSGLDTGVDGPGLSADFKGRIVKIVPIGRPGDASDTLGHGTHVAGSALGSGANSNNQVTGIAPKARLYFQSVANASRRLEIHDLWDLFENAEKNGANIHSNSWGYDGGFGTYGTNAGETDEYAFNHRDFLILFAAGNEGQKFPNRITPPGTAKNVLTVGASKTVRSLPASGTSPTGGKITGIDLEANDKNQLASFSSVGPIQDGRRKPDVAAPGSWILSTRSTVSVKDTNEDSNFTRDEAVGYGLPGKPMFGVSGNLNSPSLPPNCPAGAEQLYMYDSGTSMATPIVAGACALLRQFLVEKVKHSPSAALIKALIINGAVDMGMGVPHHGQGWGRINVLNALSSLAGQALQFDDVLENAVSTGQIKRYAVEVPSSSLSFETTLVWRDAPGSTIQNKLHLRVFGETPGIPLVSDPISAIQNNVQKIILENVAPGKYFIEVEGINIVAGIPEFPEALRQDFALVTSGTNGLVLLK